VGADGLAVAAVAENHARREALETKMGENGEGIWFLPSRGTAVLRP